MKLTSNASRGGLLGPLSSKPTTLSPRIGLEWLRRARRNQGWKERRLGGKGEPKQSKGRYEKWRNVDRKGKTCLSKGAGLCLTRPWKAWANNASGKAELNKAWVGCKGTILHLCAKTEP